MNLTNEAHAYLQTVIAADADDLAEHLRINRVQAGRVLGQLHREGRALVAAPRTNYQVDGKSYPALPLFAAAPERA